MTKYASRSWIIRNETENKQVEKLIVVSLFIIDDVTTTHLIVHHNVFYGFVLTKDQNLQS